MDGSLARRRLLKSLAAAVPATAGCIGGTPDEIPVDLQNDDNREWALAVEIREEAGEEPVFERTVSLGAGDQRSATVELEAGETYVVDASLPDADAELREEVSTGGGTVSLTIEIRSGGELRTQKTVQ